MTFKDYYSVLGVSPQATAEEIRQAYKKLAVRHHPDKNPGDQAAEQRFKEISEAKEVLLDPDNRQKYDALSQRLASMRSRPQGPVPGQPDLDDVFSIFFEEVFGGRRGPRQGRTQEGHIKISLEEAYRGMNDILQHEGKRLRIQIKPGIADGQTLRVKGQGGAGKLGGPPGDLLLTIVVKPHPVFERKGNDLYARISAPLYDVLLGRKITVPSLDGSKAVAVPPGTQPGEKLKLRGLGMPHYDNPDLRGDLYIQIDVTLPSRLSPEQRRKLEEIEQMG
ncbi:MAG: DnaJ C-terminal domain-containing protein [Bacteroidia bacterium]